MSSIFIPFPLEEDSRYWEQPNPLRIVLDETHALMTEADFKLLPDYSHSQPTGVWPGKMWKRCFGEGHPWYLHWFGLDPNPAFCSNHCRQILLC